MKTQLKKDESIILTTKCHWFTLVYSFLLAFLGLIIGGMSIAMYNMDMGNGVVMAIGLIICAILILTFVYKIFQRKKYLWTVTNIRVIAEYGVFSHNSKESPLDKINNVSYSQSLFGRMFNYGNVQIQTAAEIGSTIYEYVVHPKVLKDTITNMVEENKTQQIKKQASELANAIITGQPTNASSDISVELEKLFELKKKGILTEEEYNTRKTKILNS